MNKKTNIYIGIGIIMVVAIIGGIFIRNNAQRKIKRNEDLIKAQIAEQSAGKTNTIDNSELIEIAKNYLLTNPKLLIDRDKTVEISLGSDLEWIFSQKVFVNYTEPNKNKPPYDDLNDKYQVGWFFIPGCKEDPNSKNNPNWFDEKGRPCLGGSALSVIINSDGTINHAELNNRN